MIGTTELREKLADARAEAKDLELAIRDLELEGKESSDEAGRLFQLNARIDGLSAALAEAERIEEEDITRKRREARARTTAAADMVADEMAETARALDAALIQVELAHEALLLKQMELRQALAAAGLADAGNRLHNTTGAGIRWAVWHHAPLLAKDLAIPNCPVHRRRSLAETVTAALPAIPREEAA
jgi:hypothetical protein